MKKILLGATALSIMGFAGAASAQEWSARVGGFMTLGLGYIDADDTINNIETTVVNNAEVIFNFRLVADNGITFGAKVEMEANGGPQNVDEYVGFFEGSFGRVEIGAEDGAHDILVGSAPGGNFSSALDEGGLIFDLNSVGLGINTQGNDTGDGLKVTYYTPTFSGFTAGISYSPDGQEGRTASNSLTNFDLDADGNPIGNLGEGIELGARYLNTFGDVSFRLAGGYTTFINDANPRDDAYTIAGDVGFAGFKVGGIYGVTNFEDDEDRDAFGIGAEYRTGPWFFGVQYGQVMDGPFEDNYGVSVEANYALAPGVTSGVSFEYGEFDETPAGVDEDVYAVAVWLGLNF